MTLPPQPPHAQLSRRRLGEDDAGVVQVDGGGAPPGAGGGPVPRHRAQGELQAGRGGGRGGGGREHRAVDGPGGGGHVDRVRWGLALGRVGLGGGEEPQSAEGTWVVLTRVGGREAKEG